MRGLSRAAFVLAVAAPVAAAPAPAPVPVEPVSCADAGVLLARTFAAYDEGMVAKHEGEIGKACSDGKWPQAVLDCLGATVGETQACLEKLSHDQQVALIASVTPAAPPVSQQQPTDDGDDDHYTPCASAIASPQAFGGAPATTGDDATFELALRHYELVDACDDDTWPEPAKACFAAAGDMDHVLACVQKLPDHAQTGVVTAVEAAAELAQKTFAARKTAAAITCAKVSDKHYSDAAWKDRLAKSKPADKKAAVAQSRKKLVATCTAEKWSATERACLAAGGSYPACTDTSHDRFGFPADGVLVSTGLAACDQYLAAFVKAAECPGAKDMRETMYGLEDAAFEAISNVPADQRQLAVESCLQGMAAITEEQKSLGCK